MNKEQNSPEKDFQQDQSNEAALPATPIDSEDLVRAKNPNPRANENIDNGFIDTGKEKGIGSEITDGEGG